MCQWLPIRTQEVRLFRLVPWQKGRFTYMRTVQGKTVKANETASDFALGAEAAGARFFWCASIR